MIGFSRWCSQEIFFLSINKFSLSTCLRGPLYGHHRIKCFYCWELAIIPTLQPSSTYPPIHYKTLLLVGGACHQPNQPLGCLPNTLSNRTTMATSTPFNLARINPKEVRVRAFSTEVMVSIKKPHIMIEWFPERGPQRRTKPNVVCPIFWKTHSQQQEGVFQGFGHFSEVLRRPRMCQRHHLLKFVESFHKTLNYQ